jgi:hypothetical protein
MPLKIRHFQTVSFTELSNRRPHPSWSEAEVRQEPSTTSFGSFTNIRKLCCLDEIKSTQTFARLPGG